MSDEWIYIKIWLQLVISIYWMTECDIFGDKQLSTFMEFQIDYYVELARIRIAQIYKKKSFLCSRLWTFISINHALWWINVLLTSILFFRFYMPMVSWIIRADSCVMLFGIPTSRPNLNPGIRDLKIWIPVPFPGFKFAQKFEKFDWISMTDDKIFNYKYLIFVYNKLFGWFYQFRLHKHWKWV